MSVNPRRFSALFSDPAPPFCKPKSILSCFLHFFILLITNRIDKI